MSAYSNPEKILQRVLDTLRENAEPMTTIEVVKVIAVDKGLEWNDIDQSAFKASIYTVMKRLEVSNLIKEVDRSKGGVISWALCGD